MITKKLSLGTALVLLVLSTAAVPQDRDLAIVERVIPLGLVDIDSQEHVVWEVVYHHDRKLINQRVVTNSRTRPFWSGQRIPVISSENHEFYLIDYDRIDSVFSTEILRDDNG